MIMLKLLLAILVCCCYSQLVTSQISKNTVSCTHMPKLMICFVFCVVIIQPPQNQSVCDGGTVNFTCVVMFTSGPLSGANWFTDDGFTDVITRPGHIVTDDSNGRSAPANVTTVLTVTSVNISNDRTDYICVQGINGPRSDTVFLTVLGE